MTMIMQFVMWVTVQFGLPVCDLSPDTEGCVEYQQIAGESSSNHYSSESRDMRKVWKIYNGF